MATDEQLSDVLSEFARTILTDFPIQAILDHLVERIVAIMPVTAAGVTLISHTTDRPRYVAASNEAALRFERLQSTLSEGPCLAAFRTGEAVSVADLRHDDRFRAFAPPAVRSGLAAVFAFPLRPGRGAALGALDLYRDTPGMLDAPAMKAAQTLADVATAYILNAQARDDLKESSDRFRARALHDPLTGLPNRVLFRQLLDQAVLRNQRAGGQIAVLFADLDRFKHVNDRFGHHTGDELLIAVAHRLTGLVRPGDTLARLAGDEFVILCDGFDTVAAVEALAERVGDGMHEPFALSDRDLTISASLGIAYSGPGGDVPEQLLRDADAAMYQAKRRHGAEHQVFDLRHGLAYDRPLDLRIDLDDVATSGEITAHYQPIVATADGSTVGFEALARWLHPTRGALAPAVVLAGAEPSHALCEIGQSVLRQACLDRHHWQGISALDRELEITVNVSAHELLSRDYVITLTDVIAETDTPPHVLTIEVTEAVLIADPSRAFVVLSQIKELGVNLALDDFGTGYSSLTYLQEFPVDIVKIDGSVVGRLGHDLAGARLVASIIDLAHAMDLIVVAEGVETANQFHEIAALGCERSQGFHHAHPMPAEQVSALVCVR